MEQRFGSARFTYSTAYNALYRMERQGLVRVANGNAHGSGEAVYEAGKMGLLR